ncbi:hypothetical protein LCGC14_2959910, partial [marine sediment metagenome]
MSQYKVKHGSLFTGIGGFDLGFEQADIKPVWQVEIGKHANKVLEKRFPDVHRELDVCKVGKRNLEPVDVITFGSPCQDLSIAGKRKGMEGKRSGLFFEAIRIIRELNPAIAVWENVLGAFSSNSGRDFRDVLNSLVECGAADVAWRVLDAQYFGVPQQRRRIFLVADFRERRAGEILFECESMSRDTPKGGKAGEGITRPIKTGFDSHCETQENYIIALSHTKANQNPIKR